jgi:hypothetical protein
LKESRSSRRQNRKSQKQFRNPNQKKNILYLLTSLARLLFHFLPRLVLNTDDLVQSISTSLAFFELFHTNTRTRKTHAHEGLVTLSFAYSSPSSHTHPPCNTDTRQCTCMHPTNLNFKPHTYISLPLPCPRSASTCLLFVPRLLLHTLSTFTPSSASTSSRSRLFFIVLLPLSFLLIICVTHLHFFCCSFVSSPPYLPLSSSPPSLINVLGSNTSQGLKGISPSKQYKLPATI